MRFARFIAAGFGTGWAPLAPGTVGSAAALLTGAGMLLASHWLLPVAALLASLGGYVAVDRARVTGDPGWVVIDEFAGQWIAMTALMVPTWFGLIAAFILFRLLDVTKLGPIGWADRQHGTFGIMADDVIAGVASALVLASLHLAWPHLL